MTSEKKIPVVILSGGLGSGKTTLLNHILASSPDTRFAVIENEFGEIGIDQDIIDPTNTPSIIEVTDGCICCTVISEFVIALSEIYKKKDDFDFLLIETTGLAEPGPVAQVLLAYPDLADKFNLNAVVSLIDAEYAFKQLDMSEVACSQIGFADILILNKTDRVEKTIIKKIMDRLSGINAQASIILTEYANIDTDIILNADSFSPERVLELDSSISEPSVPGVEANNFMGLMDRLPSYRDEITSVGLTLPGDLDKMKLECWLTFLTSFQGEDILRMKGILSISGMEERFVIQSVHSTLTGTPALKWGESKRESRLLIIGRFLDKPMLEKEFKKCLAL